jgi:hypothetical protein
MNNWIPKNKIVKFSAVVAFLSIVLYFGGLFIVLKETKKVENFYNDTESEFSKEKKFWVVKSITDTNAEVIQTLKNFFVQKNDEVKFIEQIEVVGKSSAIKFDISSIDIESTPGDSFKEDIEVKMMIGGSWEGIMRFVDKLEKMPFGVLVGNMNLDSDGSGYWSGSVEFTIFREK